MARGAPASGNGLMDMLAAGERLYVMTFVAQVGLPCLQELLCRRLVRGMAGETVALLDRRMVDAAHERVLIVAGVTEGGGVGHEKALCVLRVGVVACRAPARDDGLVLHRIFVGDARLVMALETQLGHVERQELFVIVRTVRIVAEHAERRGGREVNVLFRRNVLVMTFVAQVGDGHAQQVVGICRVRIMACRAFARNYRLMLVASQEERPAVTVIAQIGLLGPEGEDRLVLARVRGIMADAAAFFHRRMEDLPLAHRLMTLVAVLVRGRPGSSRQYEKDARAQHDGKHHG
jgi:hypothetical protein